MAPFKKFSKSVETALATAVIDTKRAFKLVQRAFAPRPKPKPAPEPEAEPAPINIAPPTDYELLIKMTSRFQPFELHVGIHGYLCANDDMEYVDFFDCDLAQALDENSHRFKMMICEYRDIQKTARGMGANWCTLDSLYTGEIPVTFPTDNEWRAFMRTFAGNNCTARLVPVPM